MAKTSHLSDFWDLLNLAEDCFVAGYKRSHRKVQFRERTSPGSAGGPARVATRSGGRDTLEVIADEVRACTGCALHAGRKQAVPGQGSDHPLIMVIGEGPGAEEDRQGNPFVGPAGRYLDSWLAAVRTDGDQQPLSRDTNVFITNIVKCRPPGNRDPHPDEIEACIGYLRRQIELLQPRVILTVGRIAAQALLGTTTGIGRLRGQVYDYQSVPLIPTYHPSAVLRDPSLRRPVWDDLKRLRALIDDA
jgi:DNA polymerase